MRLRLPMLIVPVFLAVSLASSLVSRAAAPTTVPATTRPALHFLAPASVDVARLLPMPPRPDTDEARCELRVVRQLSETRKPAEVERAVAEAKLGMSAFAPVVGPWFTPERLPLVDELLKLAQADSKYFSATGKAYFSRKRPPDEVRVKPADNDKDERSYPSGHATRGILMAWIIAELDPDHRDALMDRAREIGWDRVIAGVHYPSDIVAGRVLGQALAQEMDANPEFQRELAAAKAEFAIVKRRSTESALSTTPR
ncbi:MAG: phosphatase PAP2 family protein [Tepidisphaerales bacterium]